MSDFNNFENTVYQEEKKQHTKKTSLQFLLATLRQEWKASKNRILYTSTIIAIIMLGAILSNVIAFQVESENLLAFGTVLYVIGMICFFAIPLYSVIRGSGNLHKTFFGDANYVMLLIPARSYVQIIGRQIINIFEYLIYLIPSAIYICFMTPASSFFLSEYEQSTSYIRNVGAIFKSVFINNFSTTITVFVSSIVYVCVFQSMINFSNALYSTFIRTKRPNKLLIFVIFFFLYYFTLQIGFFKIETMQTSDIMLGLFGNWHYIVRYFIIGFLYFVATCFLIEKKIEV